MKKSFFISLIFLFIVNISFAAEIIKISAAASLTDVLSEIANLYEKRTKNEFQIDFASSSVCAKQIEKGKDCDFFFSANPKWMEYLKDKNLLNNSSIKTFLNNSIVIVVPKKSKLKINEVADLKNATIGKIALGDPSNVPAGMYAKAAFENANIWEDIFKKVVGAVNVRAALAFAENNAVDCAVVYKTDALISKKIKIAYIIPAEITPKIEYLFAKIAHETNRKNVDDFYNFIYSKESIKVFEKYGFTFIK